MVAVQPDEIAETVVDREAQLLVDIQRTREFNFEPLVTKAARAYQWETLDQEFGKDFLDWLQAGVATVACVSKSRCKGDNPVPSARKRKPATKRQQTQSHRRPRSDMATRRRRCARGKCVRVEEVPVCVKKAYAARKKEQAQRCRRALRRSLTCSSTFDAIDSDAQMAWKARLAESQAFVASLQTPNMYADANSTGVRVKAKLRKATFGRAVQNGPGGTWHTSFCLSDRKFSKTKRCRKNGIANSSERRRIPCPKTRVLQRESDAAERNEASVRLMLKEVPSWFKDAMFVASFQDARRMLATRYRHKSNSVGPCRTQHPRNRTAQAHENQRRGQLQRLWI